MKNNIDDKEMRPHAVIQVKEMAFSLLVYHFFLPYEISIGAELTNWTDMLRLRPAKKNAFADRQFSYWDISYGTRTPRLCR